MEIDTEHPQSGSGKFGLTVIDNLQIQIEKCKSEDIISFC